MRWGSQKEIDGLNYALEVFGRVEVLKEVDELVLEPLKVMATPLLMPGNSAPDFNVANADNSKSYTLNDFKGKYLFLQFWSPTSNPEGIKFQAKIKTMFDNLKTKHNLEVLSICMDEKRNDAAKLIKEKRLPGIHSFANGWNDSAAQKYGIRRIPSYWLIAPDGKIKMTTVEINTAFLTGDRELEKIIDDRITGKDKSTPPNNQAAASESDK